MRNRAVRRLSAVVAMGLVATGVTGLAATADAAPHRGAVWIATGALAQARADHVSVVMHDRRVMVAGGECLTGEACDGFSSRSVELFDPVVNTFSPAASMGDPRVGATAVELNPSKQPTIIGNRRFHPRKVLVAGGDALGSAELYDPALATWSFTPAMFSVHVHGTATLLKGGKVLVVGGSDGNAPTTAAEIYDPSNNNWRLVAPMHVARAFHTATLLRDKRVLVVGGDPGCETCAATATSEIYDPASNSWTMGPSMSSPRAQHTATVVTAGRIVVAGGRSEGTDTDTVEVYDPKAGQWTSVAPMPSARSAHTASLFADGEILIAGGSVDGCPTGSAELYDPRHNAWRDGGTMIAGVAEHSAVVIRGGRVLIAGGISAATPTCDSTTYSNVSQTVSLTGNT